MPTRYEERPMTADRREEILTAQAAAMEKAHGDFDFTAPELPWPKGAEPRRVTLGGVPGMAALDPAVRGSTAFLHIHGGGFFGGSSATGYRAMLAMRTRWGVDGYSVEYTLTPHKTAPAQVEECAAFYRGLLDLGYDRILVGGESAGGNLAVCMTLWLKDHGIRLPAAVAASSPVLDMSGAIEKPETDVFSESDCALQKDYAADYPVTSPYVSPIYGDFSGFPPLLLQAGTTESLRYDSLYLGRLLEDRPCDCTVSIWEDAPHAIGLDVVDTWHSRACLEQILDFFAEKADLVR